MQILFIIMGTLLIFISTAHDFFVNKTFFLGPLQLLILVGGLFILALGIVWKTRWLKETLQKIKRFANSEVNPDRKRFFNGTTIDVAVHIVFLAIAFAFFIGRWNGDRPVLNLGADAANVATYAAVSDHPANFANDFVYHTTDSFGYYVSIFIPFVQFIGKIVNDYGLAYLLMAIPIIFIHLSGFYFLGKKLFKNRFFALCLAILSIVIVYTESSDYWGVYQDPQPRMLCGALLPWILTLALAAIKNYKLRPLAMAAVGAIFYVHPLSAPSIAFAVWLGFFVFKPNSRSWGKHFLDQFLEGLFLIALAIPFALTYLHYRDITARGVDFSTAAQLVESSGMAMYRLPEVIGNFGWILVSSFLLPVAVASVLVTWLHFKQKENVKIILVWIVGVFFVSFAITIFESLIDRQSNSLPIFVQLNRSLRYIVPLLETLVFLPLALAVSNASKIYWKQVFVTMVYPLIGIILIGVFSYRFYEITSPYLPIGFYAQSSVKCWMKGNLFCQSSQNESSKELVEYISNNTETDSSFVTIESLKITRVIRYQALRSIAFENRDIGILSSTSVSQALYWKDFSSQWSAVSDIKDPQTRVDEYLDLAREIGADYVVAPAEIMEGTKIEDTVVFSTHDIELIKLDQ